MEVVDEVPVPEEPSFSQQKVNYFVFYVLHPFIFLVLIIVLVGITELYNDMNNERKVLDFFFGARKKG